MAARWRKEPSETGLARVCQKPRGFELREGKQWVIKVSPLTSGRFTIIGWYWYGMGNNTYANGVAFASAEEAKADAMAYYKANKSL